MPRPPAKPSASAKGDAPPRRPRPFLRVVSALLLLPACWSLTATLFLLLRPASPPGAGAPRLTWEMVALPGGFLLWLVVYLVLPLSARSYIWAHELSHAIWALVQGVKVGKIRVRDDGGYVTLSRTNALIGLAPYFFPLYAILAILAWWILHFFVDLSPWRPLWLFVVGAAWGHHVTYTLASLAIRQQDILENGRLFSYTAIYLLNLLGVCIWVVATTPATFCEFGAIFLGQTLDAYLWTGDALAAIVRWTITVARKAIGTMPSPRKA